jgi:hypothetical protein
VSLAKLILKPALKNNKPIGDPLFLGAIRKSWVSVPPNWQFLNLKIIINERFLRK